MYEFNQVLLLLQQMCVYLVIAYLLSKTPLFIPLMQVTIRLPHKLLCYVIFSVFCIMGTYFGLHIQDSIANTRAIGAVLGGLLGGPSVGFLVGLTGGLHRYTLGGMTDVACAISTVSEGLVGGIVHSIAMRRGASSCCSIRCSSAAWRWWRKCCRWRSSWQWRAPTTKRCSWWSTSRCR